jgi:hypothetical protein
MPFSLSFPSGTYTPGIPYPGRRSRCSSKLDRLYLRSKQGKRPFLAHGWYCHTCKFFTTDAALGRGHGRITAQTRTYIVFILTHNAPVTENSDKFQLVPTKNCYRLRRIWSREQPWPAAGGLRPRRSHARSSRA